MLSAASVSKRARTFARTLASNQGDWATNGAVHMLTGYDHLLFLFGVMFFLTKFRDIVTFLTAFTIVGHADPVRVEPAAVTAPSRVSAQYQSLLRHPAWRAKPADFRQVVGQKPRP